MKKTPLSILPLPILPQPDFPGLTAAMQGRDASGQPVVLPVVTEKPLTIFLNSQEIITAMSLGDYPEALALGFLANQNILTDASQVAAVDVDAELGVIVVRTHQETDFEARTARKIRTSGCAQGTVFADIMDRFETASLPGGVPVSGAELTRLSKAVHTAPSLYLSAGAIHGCVLANKDKPLIYMEDIGRHNAVDKIAGLMLMQQIDGADKLLYTTGRLTSEMVIKTVLMGIPILVSRSGFTEAGVELARQSGLTLVGRARGSRFIVLAGEQRIRFDAPPDAAADTGSSAQRRLSGRG